jgi:hypothetical protein
MASKNHSESVASDAARGVGWTSVATRREGSSPWSDPSWIARDAMVVSAENPDALGSFVESEPKRQS